MATLAELIAQSQEKYPEAFAKLGNTAFSNLNPGLQVGINQNIQQNAANIRSIFPANSTGLSDFIRQQSLNITNLFKLGVATTQRAEETSFLAGALTSEKETLNKRIDDSFNFTKEVQDQLGNIDTQLRNAVKDAGSSFDFLTNNPIAFGLGAGLVVGALALILVLKR